MPYQRFARGGKVSPPGRRPRHDDEAFANMIDTCGIPSRYLAPRFATEETTTDFYLQLGLDSDDLDDLRDRLLPQMSNSRDRIRYDYFRGLYIGIGNAFNIVRKSETPATEEVVEPTQDSVMETTPESATESPTQNPTQTSEATASVPILPVTEQTTTAAATPAPESPDLEPDIPMADETTEKTEESTVSEVITKIDSDSKRPEKKRKRKKKKSPSTTPTSPAPPDLTPPEKNSTEAPQPQIPVKETVNERNYKVLIRGLPSNAKTEDISSELEKRNLKIVKIVQFQRRVGGAIKLLPLFLVVIKETPNHPIVYTISHIGETPIKVEKFHGGSRHESETEKRKNW